MDDYDLKEVRDFIVNIEDALAEQDDFRLEELLGNMVIEVQIVSDDIALVEQWFTKVFEEKYLQINEPCLSVILRQFTFIQNKVSIQLVDLAKAMIKANKGRYKEIGLRQVASEIVEG